jgi:hypothetical protein
MRNISIAKAPFLACVSVSYKCQSGSSCSVAGVLSAAAASLSAHGHCANHAWWWLAMQHKI